MTRSWCKIASNLDSDPKIIKAGRNGREVFMFALRMNAEPNNPISGRLPAEQLEPWYLSARLQMPECDAVTGVTAACDAGLITRDGDSYVIMGWKEGWGKDNGTGAERAARFRENRRLQSRNVTSNARNVTSNARNASNVDQTRLDKTIEDMSGKPDVDVDPGLAFAQKAVAEINRRSGAKYRPDTGSVLKLCRALIRNRYTPEQAERVIASKQNWIGDPKMGQFFRPATLLASENFAAYLDDIEAGTPKRVQRVTRQDSPDDEPQLDHLFMIEPVGT